MTAKIIDGKTIKKDLLKQARKEIVKNKLHPSLAVFLVGNAEDSKKYVELKKKACKKVGIELRDYVCDENNTSQQDLLDTMNFLNNDEGTDAILVQLPLPKKFNQQEIIDSMDPKKDVDGFHPQSIENFIQGKSDFMPGLSQGIIKLLDETKISLTNKTAVIVANSPVFSKPLKKLLIDKKINVSTFSPDEKNLKEKTKLADILIVAIGRPRFITANMVKPGAVVIDVGTNQIEGNTVGDVDFNNVADIAGYITPVPGGVGPVTVGMLIQNVVKISQNRQNQKRDA